MGNLLQGELKAFLPGRMLKARDLNRIMQADWMTQGVWPTMGAAGGRFPGGNVMVPLQSPTPAAATTIFPAWYPFFTQDSSGNYYANFYPGTVGGILPSNMLSALGLTQSVTNYIYLEMSASSGNLTAATIAASTSYPSLASATSGTPPTSFNIPIAIALLGNSPPTIDNVVGFGNIWAQPYEAILDTINTGALLTAPFTPWFNWTWGAAA